VNKSEKERLREEVSEMDNESKTIRCAKKCRLRRTKANELRSKVIKINGKASRKEWLANKRVELSGHQTDWRRKSHLNATKLN
jgi:hypothetical protein